MQFIFDPNLAKHAEHYVKKAKSSLQEVLKQKEIGFLTLPDQESLWQSCLQRAEQVQKIADQFVVIGIGGSSLGAKAIQQALLYHSPQASNLHFFENTDAFEFHHRVQLLGDLSKTHWVIISKSGTTLETLSIANFVEQYLKKKNLSLAKNSTVITENKSNPLFDWAKKEQIPILEVPQNVGGRFSVLSAVGMFPAALMGADIKGLRLGAQQALHHQEMVVQLAAHALASFERKEFITVFWSYSERLYAFSFWLQQLWAESLSKAMDQNGKPAPQVSTPLPLLGTNDQHSVLQQIMEGAKDKFVWFFRAKDSEAFGEKLSHSLFPSTEYALDKDLGRMYQAAADSTQKALQEQGVSTFALKVRSVDEVVLGELFMTFQLLVATLGQALQINTFDQPGVELGKRLALEQLHKER